MCSEQLLKFCANAASVRAVIIHAFYMHKRHFIASYTLVGYVRVHAFM